MKATENQKRKMKEYYLKNKERFYQAKHDYYWANRDECRRLNKIAQRKHWGKIKLEVLTFYGNSKCVCVRCGFNDIRALSIDHINGGGTKDRTIGTAISGWRFYKILKERGYPSGFQTLCMNCQFIKRCENGEVRKK